MPIYKEYEYEADDPEYHDLVRADIRKLQKGVTWGGIAVFIGFIGWQALSLIHAGTGLIHQLTHLAH